MGGAAQSRRRPFRAAQAVLTMLVVLATWTAWIVSAPRAPSAPLPPRQSLSVTDVAPDTPFGGIPPSDRTAGGGGLFSTGGRVGDLVSDPRSTTVTLYATTEFSGVW